MEYYWITGTSRGLGAALAQDLAAPGRTVVGLSRSPNLVLGSEYRHIAIDLTNLDEISRRAEEVFAIHGPATRLCLINNAGTLGEIGPVGTLGPAVAHTVNLNAGALFTLCDRFAAVFQEHDAEKLIVNITSGAALRPIAAASLYCATKAAVDMFTRTMGMEQEGQDRPVRVVAISPGMVETGMQETIRAQDAADMPASDQFREAKESGKVRDPREVAAILIANLFDDHKNGSILHIRDFA